MDLAIHPFIESTGMVFPTMLGCDVRYLPEYDQQIIDVFDISGLISFSGLVQGITAVQL